MTSRNQLGGKSAQKRSSENGKKSVVQIDHRVMGKTCPSIASLLLITIAVGSGLLPLTGRAGNLLSTVASARLILLAVRRATTLNLQTMFRASLNMSVSHQRD